MNRRQAAYSALIAISAFAASPAHAAELPDIQTSPKNAVPQCATPGRFLAFMKSRNGEMEPRFETIATEYMRHGEKLGVRWDYALFQMMIETGNLSFKNGNRQGDVRPAQNNFAGLGATGKGEHGESFPDVSAGAKAHLQHLLLYAGIAVDNPVAERTRKVHEWGVLTSWQKGFKRSITFADLAKKWAPGTGNYAAMIETISEKFYGEACKQADPNPELVAEARGQRKAEPVKTADAPVDPKSDRVTGQELAKKAIADGKSEGNDAKSSLGATATALASGALKLLNAPVAEAVPAVPEAKAADIKPSDTKPVQTAAAAGVAGAAAKAIAPPAPAAQPQKCRVWTASYGGQKAMIIRSVTAEAVNFHVLDVNEGQETREADAFIAAYAKGGSIEGRFGTQSQALDKAFDLCPEG